MDTRSKSRVVSSQLSVLRHVKLEHLLAGVSGGVVSTLVLHPLDLVKIRFQVNDGFGQAKSERPVYKGTLDALWTIGRTDGMHGLYQGVAPNVIGAGISWGMYFFCYNFIKTWMQDGNSQHAMGPARHMLAASEAGFITLVLTNPIWVSKTRLCLQFEGPKGAVPTSGHYYRGMADCLLKVYKYEGVRGLYKGFVPGVFGISHGALQFMAYEEMKTMYNQYLKQTVDTRLSTLEYVGFAAVSKMFAATVTYPYQVVRSRLQDQHSQYNGVRDVLKQTLKNEGLHGFFKGMVPCVLRVTPACVLTFVVYENIITYWPSKDPEES